MTIIKGVYYHYFGGYMNGIPYVLPENMRLTCSEIPMLIIRL